MRKLSALIMFLIFILLDLSFKGPIIEVFSYSGFSFQTPSISKTIFSIASITLIIFSIHFIALTLFSRFILCLICMFLTFPSVILFKNMGVNPEILFAHILFFFTALFFLKFIPINIKSRTLKFNQRFYILFLCSIIMSIPFFLIYKWNVNFNTFLLEDIYETRALQKEMNNPLLGYTYSWLSKMILPITIVYSIWLKKYFNTIMLICLLSYMYMIGAHKTILLGAVVVISFSFIPKKYILISLVGGVFTILSVGQLIYHFLNEPFLAGLISRRVFFVPALLDTYYFEFFRDRHICWSGSFLGDFINYPYELSPPKLIGFTYFNSADMSANNGIISDGFMNLGWFGIMINILVVSSVLSFFNSLKIHCKFYGIFLLLLFSFVSSSLPTVMVTHGGAVLVLVSLFILKNTINTNL